MLFGTMTDCASLNRSSATVLAWFARRRFSRKRAFSNIRSRMRDSELSVDSDDERDLVILRASGLSQGEVCASIPLGGKLGDLCVPINSIIVSSNNENSLYLALYEAKFPHRNFHPLLAVD